jgi:large subunit ribosomal protein L29
MPRDIKAHKVRQDMTQDEILSQLADLTESQFNLRFRNTMKQLDNPLELRNVRREIAILKTVLKENELGIRKLRAERSAKDEG